MQLIKSQLGMISKSLEEGSEKLDIGSCEGVGVDVLQKYVYDNELISHRKRKVKT